MTKPRLIADSANDNTIDGDRLIDGSVSNDKLDSGIDGTKLQDDSVPLSKLDTGSGGIPSTEVDFIATSAGTSVVTRTVSAALNDAISVKDFGAVGDGVADDTNAIQSAVYTLQGTGRALYFPAGRYKITNSIFVPFNYSGTSYPANQVVMFRMFGDGTNATRIEWHGTYPMTQVRKAMMILEGFCSLSDLTLICPRRYRGFNPEFANIRTPYYGIAMTNTAWRAGFSNVAIKYVHVPFSAGVIKKWNSASTPPEDRFALEPTSGGSTFSVDFAQNTYINCTFEALTDEFFDGTFDANTTLNANGTNLARGSAETVDLSTASFSDGSFALEIGKPQSVINNFIGCQIVQVNPNSIGAIRVHDNSQTSFDGCMIVSGYGRIGIFCHCPTFTGPSVFTVACYYIGNIAGWSSTQGLLSVRDCDGEWVRPSGGATPAEDLYLLCGHIYGASSFGTRLIMDNMVAVRAIGYNKVFSLRGGTRGTTASVGTVESSIVRNKMSPMWWQGRIDIAGVSYSNVPANAVSLANDLPSVLRNSANQPESLPASAYTCRAAATRSNWGTRIIRGGRWFFSANIGSTNFIAPAFAIDGETGAYNISVDIWLKLQSGKTTSDLTANNVKCEVYWLSVSDINTVVNGGVAAPVLFNGTSFGELRNNSITTKIANMVIPPTNAGWMELRITSSGTSAVVVDEIGVGNFKVWDVLCADCSPLVTSY